MNCALDFIESIRRDHDFADPNWTEVTIWCRWCGVDHLVTRGREQLELVPGSLEAEAAAGTPRLHRLPPRPAGVSASWCRWHETASPEYWADCAYCGANRVHVHQDMLGHVKPGRSGQGYVVERCAACHRYNAVHPVGQRAIRTAQLDNGAPVLQLTMGRM